MQIVVTPSKKVVDRARHLDFNDSADTCLYGRSRTMALMLSEMFKPIHYIGVTTILSHKLKNDRQYALSRTGPVYTGEFIKTAIKILGEKRVRIFMHWKEDGFGVLMLGTKEGTVAIAPRVWDDDDKIHHIDNETELLSKYWRGPTSKLMRGILFGTL